jgi:hypothetical protein
LPWFSLWAWRKFDVFDLLLQIIDLILQFLKWPALGLRFRLQTES